MTTFFYYLCTNNNNIGQKKKNENKTITISNRFDADSEHHISDKCT